MRSWIKNLHVDISGPADAEPILLLHGWGSNAGLMRPLAMALQDRYRIFNIDLPGHGQTPPPPAPWGVPEHAQLVDAFITQNIHRQIHVIGHSNGGRISLFMASDPAYAKQIQSLCLISPSGIKPKRTLKYHIKKGLATTLKAPFKPLPSSWQAYGLDWLRHTLIWRLLGSSDYSQLQGVMREVFVKTVNCHLDEKLHRIKVPTLLFWGDRDDAVSKYQIDTLLRSVPQGEMITLEGASHYGYLDKPGVVIAALRHFLAQHPVSEHSFTP